LQGHHHIVLDLRGMILIDSAGVDVLTRASAWTRRKGGDLVLRSASPALVEQLELARRPRPTGAIPQLGADHHRARRPQLPLALVQQLRVAILDPSGLSNQ
jgi:hypothetical protein